ncbi:MAG: integrase core domain-containing protein [Pseudomonadota bacterium]
MLNGLPEGIVLDNGPEGKSRAMVDWSDRTGVLLRFIELGKPMQNAFVESFNGKTRDECLNLHWLNSRRPLGSKQWRLQCTTTPATKLPVGAFAATPGGHTRRFGTADPWRS